MKNLRSTLVIKNYCKNSGSKNVRDAPIIRLLFNVVPLLNYLIGILSLIQISKNGDKIGAYSAWVTENPKVWNELHPT